MIVFSTLAEYQTTFWIDLAIYLRDQGEKVTFLSFDDRSSVLIKNAGFDQYNIPSLARERKKEDTPSEIFKKFGVKNVQNWISHERITFDINETSILVDKFVSYLLAVDEVLKKIKDVVVVQELGGFLSVISIYIIAGHQKRDNWFIEPSFFRGKLFYNLNTFASAKITEFPSVHSGSVEEYISETLSSQAIVIPKKDRHQYNSALSKVFNIRNIYKLVEKLYRKYLLKEHQEFGYIQRYVSIHLSQVINSITLKKYYADFDETRGDDKFFYFPLHVPGDAALTLRSPKYLDQIALIDYIARNIPFGTFLYVKEHPAQIGAIQRAQITPVLDRFDNVKLISPKVNNFEIMGKASCVISINSKSGAEAIALGKRVLVLGDAFYTDSPLVAYVPDLDKFHTILCNLLNEPRSNENMDILEYFQGVWARSSAGELYDSSPENIRTFGTDLLATIN